jgi:hypothetical protein
VYNELYIWRRTTNNDGSDTVDIADWIVAIASSIIATSVTKSFDIIKFNGIAQSTGSQFTQFSSAVESQSQSIESEFESFVDLVIE